MIRRLAFASTAVMATIGSQFLTAQDNERQFTRNAVCVLQPIGTSTAKGLISFSQYSINSQVKVASSIRGLKANTTYSIYIHQSGDLTQNDKLIRNPYPEKFIKSDDWDLAIIVSDFKGTNFSCSQTEHLTLYGDKSIIGRSIALVNNNRYRG